MYDYARVISSQPIDQLCDREHACAECWEEMQYYTVDRTARPHAVATLLGAVIGGVIGHQFGSGSGNDAATVAGSLIGAAIGNRHARNSVQATALATLCARWNAARPATGAS